MANWRCRECRAQVAPGAPRCPHCPSTSFEKPEAGMTLKIARDGSVSDSAAVGAAQAAGDAWTHRAEVLISTTQERRPSLEVNLLTDDEREPEPEPAPEPVPGPEPEPEPAVPPRRTPPRTPPRPGG